MLTLRPSAQGEQRFATGAEQARIDGTAPEKGLGGPTPPRMQPAVALFNFNGRPPS